MKIVMAVPSPIGHLNPSFFIAKQLSEAGHKVVYLAAPEAVSAIESNGFNYISSPTILFSGATPFIGKTGFWERSAKRLTNRELELTKNNGELFFDSIKKENPDIVFLDSIISYNYLFFRKYFNVVLLQTMLSTYEDNYPPLTSSLIPTGTAWNKLLVKFEWQKYYLKSKLSSYTYLGDSQFGIIKRIFKKEINHFEELFLKRKTFQYGIVNVKEVILSPSSFDFPNKIRQPHQFHAGLCLTTSQETGVDKFQYFLETIPDEAKLVYCSLGTVSLVHFSKRETFYKKLIRVFSKRQEHLIISLSDFDKAKLGVLPTNIHTFKSVPQKYLLTRAAMMITHAGLNSVLECVYYNLPMLAFPLNNKWDQNGNAARVVYHGLGLRGSIKTITEKKLDALVTAVMSNVDFKANLRRMKYAFENDENKVDVVDLTVKTIKEFNNEKG